MSTHPLAEVFGFPASNLSPEAERYRRLRLCPHNNRVANCTKDKANNPLGVCSVFETSGTPAITCPIRFRQDWLIAENAAGFFFPAGATWTSLTEVRLDTRSGESAGNIDLVLVAYDEHGQVIDFGSVEVQAVYVSGNIRRPFEYYVANPAAHYMMDWHGQSNYPRPDYLSSSRKRLAPQLVYKGGILHHWGKKQAVALHQGFFNTLPVMTEVNPEAAEMAWLVYDLVLDETRNQYQLVLHRQVYTKFDEVLSRIVTPEPGAVHDFVLRLQERLDRKLENGENPPDAPLLSDVL